MRNPITFSTQLVILAVLAVPIRGLVADQNWTEFRGSQGNGQAVADTVAMQWDESSNVEWKTAIPGKGWSSPVVWENQVWVTTASEDGKEMSAICVDKRNGEVLHNRLLFENEKPSFCHPTNSYASPTPAIEAGRVYVHFGSYGTACIDSQSGDVIWQRRDLKCDHWRGPGASPVIAGDLLIVPYDGFDQQFIVAFHKDDGSTAWKKNRNIDYRSENGDFRKAYCTCTVINHAGRSELISPSAAETISYNPQTGDEYWRVRHGGMNAATRPLFAHGLLYITIGDAVGKTKPALLALRPGGDGNVTETHVAWSQSKGASKRPSPLVIGDLLYMISDDGVASCLDSKTGDFIWRKRLGGNFRASPISSGNRIYAFDLDGFCHVFKAGPEFELLAKNRLDHGSQASPAVSGNQLIVRTTKHLYSIKHAEQR
ncbi:MAG: PQQ-binding-like beta-propeller repeat protein [Planctomycetaceae bacterium]|nr:PQQ-binding-like beta-propeller repeat protein [Planctomycetaceae bacterium]